MSTPFTLALLKTECLNNPTVLVDAGSGLTLTQLYNGGGDGVCAVLLNNVIQGNTVRRIDIHPMEILGAIDDRDWATVTAAQSAWFQATCSDDVVTMQNPDGTDNKILGNLKRMLLNPGTQGSRAAVIALSSRDGSRAEFLWGSGFFVNDTMIGLSR